MNYMTRAWIGWVAAGALVPIGLAHAQIRACAGESTPGYKVFLDEIVVSGAQDNDLRVMQGRLKAKLRNDIEQLKLDTTPPVAIIHCPQRRPGDASEFQKQLLEAMNSNKVVLEVWGNVSPGKTSRAEHEAVLNIAMIPVWLDRYAGGDPPGVYSVSLRKKLSAGADRLAELLSGSPELVAYTAIAVGTKALKERQWDQAFRCLCRGELMLGKVRDAETRQAREKLQAFVQQLSMDAVKLAQADHVYLKQGGRLALFDLSRGGPFCPRGEPL